MSNPIEVFRKQGDDWPPIFATFMDDQRVVIDLTDADVTWEQRPVSGGSWVSGGEVTTEDPPTAGIASYMPVTTTVGDFIGHFLVSQLGKHYTVPDDGYILVHVLE
jgi:hypothetical protein